MSPIAHVPVPIAILAEAAPREDGRSRLRISSYIPEEPETDVTQTLSDYDNISPSSSPSRSSRRHANHDGPSRSSNIRWQPLDSPLTGVTYEESTINSFNAVDQSRSPRHSSVKPRSMTLAEKRRFRIEASASWAESIAHSSSESSALFETRNRSPTPSYEEPRPGVHEAANLLSPLSESIRLRPGRVQVSSSTGASSSKQKKRPTSVSSNPADASSTKSSSRSRQSRQKDSGGY
ncbi:hypothetical protein BDV98DRAFT_562347 [Pterulicium gracile]|uniref:Uncharacterized protein n=1 Tax=Pterulicium gracile TaxID=1884261 RepID=A0A5C3QRA2_9AGAR|nr:hypothetical protein BDV98DRAFT_562347 [Pterula gracilis]